jgi:hypothetical protein
MSEATVEAHVLRLLSKLDVGNRVQGRDLLGRGACRLTPTPTPTPAASSAMSPWLTSTTVPNVSPSAKWGACQEGPSPVSQISGVHDALEDGPVERAADHDPSSGYDRSQSLLGHAH